MRRKAMGKDDGDDAMTKCNETFRRGGVRSPLAAAVAAVRANRGLD